MTPSIWRRSLYPGEERRQPPSDTSRANREGRLECPPDVRTRPARGAEQAAHSKGCEGADGEADGRVAESEPLTEQVTAEKASRLSGNRRHDDLERLKSDEEHRGEHPQLLEHGSQERLVLKQPDHEPVGRRVDDDEPHAVGDEEA